MKHMKSSSPPLDAFIKLWIKSKIGQFYRQDPYFKHLNTDIALSHLYAGLVSSSSLQQLTTYLEATGINSSSRITRKNDGKTFFEYPSLSFQIESLVHLWPMICGLYREKALIDVKNRFGHRPNLDSDFSNLKENSIIKLKDIKINCPLKIPFQDDYPNFKQSTVETANKILKESDLKNANVLIVQSDIEKFFHTLKLDSVKLFLSKNFSEISKESNIFFDRLQADFKFESLPIGWALSGIFSDLVAVKAHDILSRELDKRLQKTVQSIDVQSVVKRLTAEIDAAPDVIEKVKGLFKTSGVKFKSVLNYVDDLIFVLEYNISEQFKDKRVVRIFEKIVTYSLLDIAEELLNSMFEPEIGLRLYRPDDEKGRHFSFDRSNIDTLTSNFFSIANNTPSGLEEPQIWTRLDEFLLPADNELTLNERTQFFVHLASLRHKILEGESLDDANLNDIFQKIILKIQGSEAKYIVSVMKLIEVLLITNYERHLDFCTNALLRIYKEFQASNKSLELWLRFFSGYFRIFQKLSFDPKFKFYDDFDQFTIYWSKVNPNADDTDLLKAIRSSFLIKSAVGKSVGNTNWLEVMDRRRQGHKKAGVFSKNFLGFNISDRIPIVRIQINNSYDAFSIGGFFKFASRVRQTDIESYLSIGKKIKQKESLEAAVAYFNLSAFSIVPKWSDAEIDLFIQKLPSITSTVHAQVIKRLLGKAKSHQASMGETYAQRLEHLTSNLGTQSIQKIRNIPKVFGGGNVGQYRSVIFYLSTLESNSLYDLRRSYLSSLIPIESTRDFSYLQIPIALRKTGLAFYRIQQQLVNMAQDKYSPSQVVSIVNSVAQDEIKNNSGRKNQLHSFKSEAACFIDLNKIDKSFSIKYEEHSLTLCPIGMNEKTDFDENNGLKFSKGVHEKLDLRIESAIHEAKKRGAGAIVFPELTLPRRYLLRYLNMCGAKGLLLIAGVEYATDFSINCRNSTIISFPLNPKTDPYGRTYLAFEQDKHYPAAKEKKILQGKGVFKYQPGKNLFIFSSKKYCNFAVLTCSDFLSLRLRLKLQEKIQTVFVPAQNLDMTTYNHIAESSIRDLHCFAVVCNNQNIGGSFIYAPFRDRHKRTIFRKDGSTLPEFLTMKWAPGSIKKSQAADSQQPFEDVDTISHLKQTPPDWGYE